MKLKKTSPRGRVLFLSFLLPFSILLIAYFIMQFWPVGDRSPLTIDLYHQYASFISEFRRKIMSGDSLFYSWSVGLGTNFFALMAYYAASPLNLFLVFFPPEHITEAVTFLIVTKIGLSGLTFASLLSFGLARDGLFTVRSKEHKKDCTGEDIGTDAVIVALSTAYALCGFNLAFSWDIMWLDVIALLPLVILGLHKLIREQKFALYSISLGLTLFVNYYMAFFVCLFTALYFFVSYVTAKAEEEESRTQSVALLNGENVLVEKSVEDRPKLRFISTAVRFTIFTLLGVALSAILLLPTVLSLADTSAAGDAFPSSFSLRFSLFDFMTQQLMNIPPSIRDGLPNVYNGILAFVFVPLYLASQRIHLKEKIAHLTLLAFLFISFNFNVLDFIWHGMHYPNQLPYRYSFLFSFLLLLISFRTLTVIKEFSAKTLMTAIGLGILFVILAEKLNNELLQHGHAYINIAFFLIYLLLLAMIWKPNYFRTVALLLAVVMIGETTINTIITVAKIAEKEVYTARSGFVDDMNEIQDLVSQVRDLEDGGFYRMEILPAKTTNDGALYGYPGFTLFSSTSREDTAKLFRRLAYHGNNINSYKYVASTPVGNSLFGIKYLLLKNGATRDIGLEEVTREGEMTVLRNPHAIELGLVANPNFINWNPTHSNPFSIWNDLLRDMANLPKVFEVFKPEVVSGANFNPSTGDAESGLRFGPENTNQSTLMNLSYEVEEDSYLYFAINTSRTTKVTVKVSQQELESDTEPVEPSGETVPTVGETTVQLNENRSIHWLETFDVGYVRAGDLVELSFEQEADKATDVTVYGATMDKTVYEDAMAELQNRSLDVAEWQTDYISANYQAEQAGVLYLSIPYDVSWEAKIDGETVDTSWIADKALLAVDTPAGDHTLELSFRPRGFMPGLILTLAAFVILAILIWDERKFKPARLERRRRKRQAIREAKLNIPEVEFLTGDALLLPARETDRVLAETESEIEENAEKSRENEDSEESI